MVIFGARPSVAAQPSCRQQAASALLHPISLVAVGVLVVNDQVLKHAWPGAVTGKISDFAGLFFFPFLIALAVSFVVPPRWLRSAAFMLTGAVFAAINLWPQVAGVAEAALGTVGIRSTITPDPTDLVGLLAFIPAAMLWARPQRASGQWRRTVVVCAAAAACLASSPEDPPSVLDVSVIAGQMYATIDDSNPGEVFVSDDGIQWEPAGDLSEDMAAVLQFPRLRWGVICSPDAVSCWTDQSADVSYSQSVDGGITWGPSTSSVPDVFTDPPSEAYAELDGPYCSDDMATCRRILGTARFTHEWQTWTPTTGWHDGEGSDGSVTEEGRFQRRRCAARRDTDCWGLQRERGYQVSSNGGLTWAPWDGEVPEVWRSYSSAEVHQVRDALCLEHEERCFRVFNRDGRSGRIEESTDGGATWRRSWQPSLVGVP